MWEASLLVLLCCGYYLLKRKLTIEDSLVEKDSKSPHVNFCCDLGMFDSFLDFSIAIFLE